MRRIFCLLAMTAFAMPSPAFADSFEDLLKLEKQFNAFCNEAQYEEAEQIGKQMLAQVKQHFPGRLELVDACLNNLGIVYNELARYSDAEAAFLEALEMKSKRDGKDSLEVAMTLNNLSITYRGLWRIAEAESAAKRSVAILEAVLPPNDPLIASGLNSLAIIYADQSRFAEAEVLYKRALDIKINKLGADHLETALGAINLALLYQKQERSAEAERLLRRALTIQERHQRADHPQLVITLVNLGIVEYQRERYDDAVAVYQRALAIQEKHLPDHPVTARTMANLAIAYSHQKRYAEAEALNQRALAIQKKTLGENHPEVASALNNLASVCEAQSQFDKAAKLYDRSVQMLEAGEADLEMLFKSLWSRAQFRWKQNRRDEAIADLRRAMEIVERMRANFSGDEMARAESFGHYGDIFEAMIAWQSELGNADEVLSTMERWRSRALLDQIQMQGVDLLAGLPPEQAAALYRRDADAAAHVAKLERELQLLDARSDFDERQKNTSRVRLSGELRRAQAAAVEAYRAIRNASPAYRLMVGRNFKPIELPALEQWVKEQDSILLQYFTWRDGCYLMIIPADGETKIVRLTVDEEQVKTVGGKAGPMTGLQLQAALTFNEGRLSDAFKNPASRTGKTAAALEDRMAFLWPLLVPKAEREAIARAKYKRLMIVTDLYLANLPFEAFVVDRGEQGVQYLLDVGPPIVSAPSATLLYNLATRTEKSLPAASETVLSVGNPAYGAIPAPTAGGTIAALTPRSRYASLRGNLSRLPYSGWEADWVAENFNPIGLTTEKLLGNQATERAVREHAAGRKVLHLACHGLCDQTNANLFGALALTPGDPRNPSDDGFLTLAEIYKLNLTGCELAILSACETNLGPNQHGEGVFALSRGFLVAGSRRVVASNWIVDDESSASLVSAFCSALAKQHKAGQTMDYADALHQAKRWIRKQDKWRHPYYWGAFVLVGPN